MFKTALALVLALLFTLDGFARDLLPALISKDTILSAADSPHYLQQNLTIEEGVSLEIEPGLQILLSQGVVLTNYGRLLIKGTEEQNVLFTTEAPQVRWAYISNMGTLMVSHTIIRRATRFVRSYGDTVVIDHCVVEDTYGTIGDDCIGVHDANKVMITNSRIMGNPEASRIDALDLDGITDDTISGNHISGFADDGIDIGTGSQHIIIANNVIDSCEMAISVGENSTATLRKNLLTHCSSGIQSHTGSVVVAQQNTLYGNSIGLRAMHYNGELASGGTIKISNSIISNSLQAELLEADNSVVQFEYCLTDLVLRPGPGNLVGDPLFEDAPGGSYELLPASVAIDAGNPDNDADGLDFSMDPDDTDPDGSRLDLGCYPYFHTTLGFIEVSPSNLSLMMDDSGVYSDWFKLINLSGSAINMKGYYLSDNLDDILKYQINEDLYVPSGDTVIFWARGDTSASPNHLPFRLSGEGESLVLCTSGGTVIDQLTFPRIPVNYLYIKEDPSGSWIFSTYPAGSNALTYDSLCNDPFYNNPGGASTFPLAVAITSESPLDEIFYSLDGSNPMEGARYEAPLIIQEPVTLRSIDKKANHLSGYAQAATYYPDKAYSLPVISISTNEEHLYGDDGIYTRYLSSGPRWERPASLSYYDGLIQFSSIAGIRIQGGNSVFMPKKAFRMHFRGGYGSSRLTGTPFAEGPSSFKNLVFRSGYDDDITMQNGTLLRDPFSTDLWKRLGELATESSFAVLLLNNNYWGIYNIRESINEYFVSDHLGIEDFDLVRFQKWGADLKYGSLDEWNKLVSYFDSTDFTRPEVYDEVSAFMDMNSLLNLLSLVHCSQFRSWTWGAFATKPKGGLWSWTIWDSDRSYNTVEWNGFTEYAQTSAEKWPNFIPQKLILNEGFCHALINRNCDLLNTLFKPSSAIDIYDSLANILAPEMDAEYGRWNPGNRARWDINNESIRNFLRTRPSHLYDQMKSYFGIEDTTQINLRIVGNGTVKLNSLEIDQETWTGVYMKGVPIYLEAIPSPGVKFIEWRGISNQEMLELDPGSREEIVAVFETVTLETRLSIVINEIMYRPLSSRSSEWIELYNPNDFSVSLEGFVFSDRGANNLFVFPADAIVGPLDFFVVAGDLADYRSEFVSSEDLTGNFNSGETGFNLSNDGEGIDLRNSSGELEDYVQYDNMFPWPEGADGKGPSLQLISPDLDNNNPAHWYASTAMPYSPGKQNGGNPNHSKSPPENKAMRIYPNPVGETLFIEVPDAFGPDIQLRVFSLAGKNVANARFQTTNQQGPIAWKHGLRDPGAYILQIFSVQGEPPWVKTQLLIISKEP